MRRKLSGVASLSEKIGFVFVDQILHFGNILLIFSHSEDST